MVDRKFLAVHLQIHHGIYAKVKHSELFQILKDDAVNLGYNTEENVPRAVLLEMSID